MHAGIWTPVIGGAVAVGPGFLLDWKPEVSAQGQSHNEPAVCVQSVSTTV